MYLTDKAAHTHGHTILRLLVAHYFLNQIELSWTSIKGYVAKHNKIHNLPVIEQITSNTFTYTETDMWRNYCRHVMDVENDYFENMNLLRTQ